jgi:MYXO-CTERM domain-containing protein
MAAPRLLLVLSCLVVLAAPAVSAKEGFASGINNPDTPSPVTLYMHLIDIQDFPINTQRPDDRWTVSNAVGVATSTTSCLPDGTPGADLSQAWHTGYGYSSPSYVEYDIQEGNKPRIHPERGISYDAHLDEGTPFTLYWYMTTQSVANAPGAGAPDPSQVPIVVPNVVVAASIRAGDAISVNDHAYNTGPLLVHGQTIPATLAGEQVLPGLPGNAAPAHTKALSKLGDGRWLYEFAVPMTIDVPVIPRDTGYNLRVDVYMDNPACTGGVDEALMPNVVRIHSDADHRPRMEFAVTNPIRIEALHPQFVGDDLVVHAAMNAVWGNYDIAEVNPSYTPDVTAADMALAVDGPTPADGLFRYNIVQSTNPHNMHQDAVTVVYVWPYKADQATDGPYAVSLLVRNDQRTATATADAVFEIGRQVTTVCDESGCEEETLGPGSDDNQAPGPLPALVGLALLGLAAAWRRQQGRV